MIGFMFGVVVGGAAVWFAKAKIISWYDALVAKI
jgi:hypothetical protein